VAEDQDRARDTHTPAKAMAPRVVPLALCSPFASGGDAFAAPPLSAPAGSSRSGPCRGG
jgi:hypothetical protein